jgi:short-subunit dehydrogenase
MLDRVSGPQHYQRALITGASSGIGAAFAEFLPGDTALLLTARRQGRLEAAATRLARGGRPVETLGADLATEEGRGAVIAAALRHPPDLFICNAGTGAGGAFDDRDFAAHRQTIAVNVVATAQLLHALLPAMIAAARAAEARCGVIIVASTAALRPRPGVACYAATKAFGLQLGLALARELAGEPVDLLVLCPTRTATEFFARAGLPLPSGTMRAEQVAREAMAALGRRTVHLCGRRHQAFHNLLAFNPALAALWRPLDLALGRARQVLSTGRAAFRGPQTRGVTTASAPRHPR